MKIVGRIKMIGRIKGFRRRKIKSCSGEKETCCSSQRKRKG